VCMLLSISLGRISIKSEKFKAKDKYEPLLAQTDRDDILRRIGKIVSMVADGHFLASVEFAPRLGAQLYSSVGRALGQVDDVVGPVSSPFVLVRPLMSGHLLNSPVFLMDKSSSERKS